MSERERWIVYPLLFFALGASLRDKLLHRVDAKEIYCESLRIVDQQDPKGQFLAELGIQRASSSNPTQLAERVGMLRLANSDGQEVSRLANQAVMQRVIGKQLLIIDDKGVPRVIAGVEPVPGMNLPNGQSSVTSQGVIYLNNQRLGIRLAPPANKKTKPNQPPNSSP